MSDPNQTNIAETFKLNSRWLLNFIKKRVPDASDAEDILQDVFINLQATQNLLTSLQHGCLQLHGIK
jgi:DNA-directed RNA polymerase specialized sigma24 family protein